MQIIKANKILSQLEKDRKVTISFHYHTESLLKSIDAIFSRLLAKVDLIYLLDSIVTILREIIANAVKANLKRYYFKKFNIDINNPEKYVEAIKNFKMQVIGRDTIEKEMLNTDYRATVILEMGKDNINVIVENNASIHPEELKRIILRIEKGKTYTDFTQAYDEIFDETEGAGLGIVLIILLLKNSGIGEDSFIITSNEKVTQAKFHIPYELKPEPITTKIKEQIVSEVDGLPTFNQNTLELLRLCKDPDSTIEHLVEKIIIDPALTSDILKLSNSAGFFMTKRIEQISEAILIIGLSNLHDLLLIVSTRSILQKRYSKFSEIWNHCTKAAEYAKHIALKFGNTRKAEYAYLGGLLHDLGKMVLLATDNKFTNWISELTQNRKIRTSTVLEEVALGISHSTIGELIAKKWNFPDYLKDAIKYHHSPLEANNRFREFIFPVYLANMLCGFEIGKYNYYYIEETVLEKYKLLSKKDIDNLHKELQENHKL